MAEIALAAFNPHSCYQELDFFDYIFVVDGVGL